MLPTRFRVVLPLIALLLAGWVIDLPAYGQQEARPAGKAAPRKAAPRKARRRNPKPLVDTTPPPLPAGIEVKSLSPVELILVLATPRDTQDRAYVQRHDHVFTGMAFLERRTVSFGFLPGPLLVRQPQYFPNRTANIGVGIYYLTFGLAGSFSLPGRGDPDRLRLLGKTRYYDLQLNRYHVRYGLDLYLQTFRGFFVARPGLLYPDRKIVEPYPQRQDARLFTTGINYYHVMSPMRYNLHAPFTMLKVQKRSAGSPIAFGSLSYTRIRGDSLLTSFTDGGPVDTAGIIRGRFYQGAIAPGYGYTWLYRQLFVGLMAAAGPALQLQHYRDRNSEDQVRLAITGKVVGRLGLGYNGDRFFAGVVGFTDVNQAFTGRLRMRTRNDRYRLVAGYRFG